MSGLNGTTPRGSDVQDVVSQLTNVKRSGTGYTARCPAHDDQRSSLSVDSGRDGKVLLKCHAGCTFEKIIGRLEMPTSVKKNGDDPIVFPYVDEAGETLYEVCRFPGKEFRQRRPDGQGGHVWKLGDVRRVLYRLPEIIEAVALGRRIFIVEGEKDVDSLISLGLEATTIAGGAGAKWLSEYSETLRDADVVILPDNDEPGRQFAARIASALTRIAQRVQTVNLPNLAERGDVTDWLMQGGTVEKLQSLIESVGEVTSADNDSLPPATCALYAPAPEPLSYIVDEMLQAGEPGMIFGDGASFKTTAALHIACSVAGGYPAFEHFATTQRPVLLVSAEDSAGVLTQRMRAMCRGHGWNTERVLQNVHYYCLGGVALTDAKWCAKILAEITRLDAGLVILDPYQELVPGVNQDSATETGPHMITLRGFCQPTKAATILIHHAGKAGKDKRVIDRVRGSSALYSAMRLVYLITDSPTDGSFTIACIKNNRAEKLTPFAVRRAIDADPDNRLNWLSARFDHITLRQAQFDKAQAFVLDTLDASGRLSTTDLKSGAKGSGISAVAVSGAIKSLEMLGVLDFEEGEKGAKLWGRKVVAQDSRQPENPSQITLPGNLDACPATSPNAPVRLPTPLGGQPAGNLSTPLATTEAEAA